MKKTQYTNPDGSVVTIWVGDYASIGNRASIGNGASIGDYARVGNGASIGNGAKRHAVRSDGHVFTVGERNGEKRVFAGCRDFNRAEALKHWDTKHPRYKETRAILKFLEL